MKPRLRPTWTVKAVRLFVVLVAAACAEPMEPTLESIELTPSFTHLPTHHGYVAIDLGTLGGATSSARYINDAGQVVGESLTESGEPHVFLWEDGVMTDLGTLGRQGATLAGAGVLPARGFSSGGQVVGWVGPEHEQFPGQIDASQANAFLWQDGTMTDLGPLGFPSNLWVNGNGSVVRRDEVWRDGPWSLIPMDRGIAISDAGVIAGMTHDPGGIGVADRLTIWDGTNLVDGGNLGDGFLIVYGINEAGQVIGRSSTNDPAPGFPGVAEQRGFFWDGSGMQDLGSLGGQDLRASQPLDVNELGEVVGSSVTASGETHAFHWQGGTMTQLGTLTGNRSTARSINDAGQIAGSEEVLGDPNSVRALMWQDGGVYDLGTLGGAWGRAVEINGSGWVVGTSHDSEGQQRATLWRPGTPLELSESLLASVEEFDLDAGVTGTLSTPLSFTVSEAIRSISTGRDNAAIGQLRAFQSQVAAFVRAGRLSELNGELLAGAADAIIASLGS